MNRLLLATLALVAAYAIGGAIAVAGGIAGLADVFTNGTKLSAPVFMLVLEPFAALACARGRIAGAYVLAALTGLATAAFLFDGDFAHQGLGPGHVAWQALEAGLALVVLALSLSAIIRTRRRPAAAAGA
jgi:hypothetical protein